MIPICLCGRPILDDTEELQKLRAENARLRDEIAALRPLESLAVKLSGEYDLKVCTDELMAFARTWGKS